MTLIEDLQWRYATKKMNGEKVSEDKLNTILDAVQLSASSYGLQPYTILVITNAEVKASLLPAAYGQTQLVDSSHLLVFAVWEDITAAEVTTFINDTAAKRGIPVEALAGYQGMIQGTIDSLNQEQKQTWAAKQAYLALGTALVAAASVRVDATPMEGFSAPQFDEILGLKAKGLKSVVIMPLGYRSEEDELATAVKVRRDKELLFEFIS